MAGRAGRALPYPVHPTPLPTTATQATSAPLPARRPYMPLPLTRPLHTRIAANVYYAAVQPQRGTPCCCPSRTWFPCPSAAHHYHACRITGLHSAHLRLTTHRTPLRDGKKKKAAYLPVAFTVTTTPHTPITYLPWTSPVVPIPAFNYAHACRLVCCVRAAALRVCPHAGSSTSSFWFRTPYWFGLCR